MNYSKRIGLRVGFAALAVTVLGTCLAMSTRADDIAGSFSTASNPNGAWSYGSFVESTSTFVPLATSGTDCGLPFWAGPGGFPVVVGNNTGSSVSCSSWTLPTDTLNLHPTDIAGTDADVRWTAPAAGTYTINGSYSALDLTTTFDSVLVNGASLFSINIDASTKSSSFALTQTLAAGSTIDFTVNCCSGLDHDYFNDSTGLKGTIDLSSNAAPEPSTLLLVFSASALLFPLIRHRLS